MRIYLIMCAVALLGLGVATANQVTTTTTTTPPQTSSSNNPASRSSAAVNAQGASAGASRGAIATTGSAVSNIPQSSKTTSAQKNAATAVPRERSLTEQDVTTVMEREQSTQRIQRLQSDTVGVMSHVTAARSDIKRRDRDAARDDLLAAAALVDRVRLAEPVYIIKDRIRIAKNKLDYENADRVTPDLATIETEITSIESSIPAEAVRTHLDQARTDLGKKNKRSAQSQLQMAADALVMRDTVLPVQEAVSDITLAQKALIKKQYKQADQALARLENAMLPTVNTAMNFRRPAPAVANENAGSVGSGNQNVGEGQRGSGNVRGSSGAGAVNSGAESNMNRGGSRGGGSVNSVNGAQGGWLNQNLPKAQPAQSGSGASNQNNR